MERCGWCAGDALYELYHDREWGVPEHDDRRLFEFLILEGAQAGLSWITVLKKRERYRKVMAGFDPEILAAWGDVEIDRWLIDPGIIRNRLKLKGTIQNARAFCMVKQEYGSFDNYLWGFVGGRPIQNSWTSLSEIPAQTPTAVALSKDLKKRGFTFVGPTICYALMQAVGMVNDHLVSCFRHQELSP